MRVEGAQTLRLFVACPIPNDVIRGLGAVQDDIRAAGFDRLRYVRPEGIHITLKFLGAVEAGRVSEITEALEHVVDPFSLRLTIDRLGGFGGERLRVVWAGLAGDLAALAALAGRVGAALEPLGFAHEGRPFAPHLTLARVRDDAPPDDRRRLGAFVQGCAFPSFAPMIVSEVVLMRSILGPGGAVYERLMTLPAQQGENA